MKPWFIIKNNSNASALEEIQDELKIDHINSRLLIDCFNEGYSLSRDAGYHWGYVGNNQKVINILSDFNDYLDHSTKSRKGMRQRVSTFQTLCKDFIKFLLDNHSVKALADEDVDDLDDVECVQKILNLSGADLDCLVLVGLPKTKSGSSAYRGKANKYIDKIERMDVPVVEENDESISEPSILINSVNMILEGVAGCGKTYYQKSLFNSQDVNGQLGFNPERSETVVFHPSTSYEDFVSGLRPLKNGNFTGKAGIFVELCNRAAADPKNNYLLFIDEINRANTAKVFGDLLMVIEEGKRAPVAKLNTYKRAVLTRKEAKSLEITSVRLQTAIDTLPEKANPPVGKDKDDVDLEYLAVPDNLYIVGTMNSTDRSVGTIDLALRRRFTWHTMEPMGEEIEDLLGNRKKGLQDIIKWYVDANKVLNDKVGPDARLGHSYFFQDDKSEQIAHDLLKQLAEIAYIFHLEDLMTKEPFNRPIQGLYLDKAGEGLGQKIIVKKVSDNNSGKASEKPDATESESGESPESSQEI